MAPVDLACNVPVCSASDYRHVSVYPVIKGRYMYICMSCVAHSALKQSRIKGTEVAGATDIGMDFGIS